MNQFKGKLGDYKIINTSDQSYTLWSEAFDENCHSLAGAIEETRYIYLDGCELDKKAQNGNVSILEVGFGLGHGFKETFLFFQKKYPDCKVQFYSLELDEDLVFWAFENHLKLKCPNKKDHFFKGEIGNFSYTIIICDARKTAPIFSFPPINAIFQDAFSPKKNPSLWTVEWFEFLKTISSSDVILSSYSASSKVKKALLLAGWSLTERRGFSGKRGSIKANLSGIQDITVLEKLKRSPTSALRD